MDHLLPIRIILSVAFVRTVLMGSVRVYFGIW